jgi:hypothetical protein
MRCIASRWIALRRVVCERQGGSESECPRPSPYPIPRRLPSHRLPTHDCPPGHPQAKDRYIVAEFTDPTFGTTDDVEFLFSLDSKGFVNYRSAARATGGDDKRHRERVKELRKALQVSGWRSLGRLPL